MRWPGLGAAMVGMVAVGPLAAQERPFGYRGPALEVYLVRTPAWQAELQDAPRNTYAIPAAGGIGLSFAWALTPHVAPFVVADVVLYGESAHSTVAAGVEGRLPLAGRVVPRATVALGRLRTSGGIGYDLAQLAGGADLFLLSRLALRAEVRQQVRLGEAKGGLGARGPDGPYPAVPAVITGGGPRFSLGAVWYMGRRSAT